MSVASEDRASALARVVPIVLPAHDEATTVRLGRAELVLENRRGSFSLLWSDGRDARRFVLGLAGQGELCVELRAPRFPVRCVPADVLTLVPGARLRGFVTIPLIPTVVWRDSAGAAHKLVELLPSELRAVWSEAEGHAFQVGVQWLTRFPYAGGQPQAVLPLRLYNASPETISPAGLDVEVRDDQLRELRGSLVARPRRITLSPDMIAGRSSSDETVGGGGE